MYFKCTVVSVFRFSHTGGAASDESISLVLRCDWPKVQETGYYDLIIGCVVMRVGIPC